MAFVPVGTPPDGAPMIWGQTNGVWGWYNQSLTSYIAGRTIPATNNLYLSQVSGATPDALYISDANMTSGSPILTSISGKFLRSHIGKPIYVSSAGAFPSDLITTILSWQSPTQVTLATNCLNNVTNVGAVWGTDNGPVLGTALTTLSATRVGGTLTIDGTYAFFTNPTGLISGSTGGPIRITGVNGTRVYPCLGGSTPWINIANMPGFEMDHLIFVGAKTCVNAASHLVLAGSVDPVHIHDCEFFGIHAIAVNTPIINVTNALAIWIERCLFAGCVGNSGQFVSIIDCSAANGGAITIDGCSFPDFGTIDGQFLDLSGNAGYAAVQIRPTPRSVASVKRCFFDEGASAVILGPEGTGIQFASIEIANCTVNSVTFAQGFSIQATVSRVNIHDCFVGYFSSTTDRVVIGLFGAITVGVINIERVFTGTPGVNTFPGQFNIAGTTTTVNVKDCVFTTVTSTSTHLFISSNGIPAALPATTSTTGFMALPNVAGAPTGVPAEGAGSTVWDTTNSKVWYYTGTAWKGLVPA